MRIIILSLHFLGTMAWVGGYLYLALLVLPKAWRAGDAGPVRRFESRFKRVEVIALAVQGLTGFWLAYRLLPDLNEWFRVQSLAAGFIILKLLLFSVVIALVIDARLRVLRHRDSHDLKALARHIIPITVIAVLFIGVGVGFRALGGY